MYKELDFLTVMDLSTTYLDNKGKYRDKLNQLNLNVSQGDILSIVGENKSGKTSLGLALSGLTKTVGGTVFFKNKILLGKIIDVFKINKINAEILKKLSKLLNENKNRTEFSLEIAKKKYFELVKNVKYSSSGKIKNFKRDRRVDLEDISGTMQMVSINGKRQFIYGNTLKLEAVDLIIKLLNNILRQERFFELLDWDSPFYSKYYYDSYIKKMGIFKNYLNKLKHSMIEVYEIGNDLSVARYEMKKMFSSVKEFYKVVFSKIEYMLNIYKEVSGFFKDVVDYSNQLTAMSAPIGIKRAKYIKHYSDIVNAKRTKIKKIFYGIRNKIEKNIKTGKKPQKEVYRETNLAKVNEIIYNLWHKKTFNFKAVNSYFGYIKKSLISDKQIKPIKLNALKAKLNCKAFETEVNLLNDKVLENSFTLYEVEQLENDINYIKKVVRKNVVTHKIILNFYFRYFKRSMNISDVKVDEYLDILKLLEIPSFNDITKTSLFYREPNKLQKSKNLTRIQMIFKDPFESMNNKSTIGQIIGEIFEKNHDIYKQHAIREECVEWHNINLNEEFFEDITIDSITDEEVKTYIISKALRKVGLPPENLNKYAHEFSPIEIYKVALARAFVLNPEVIIIDEPGSSLDLNVKSQIISLIQSWAKEQKISFIILDNDISSVRQYSDRIAIIYNGKIVENAETEDLFKRPVHKYTKSLIEAVPSLNINKIANDVEYFNETDGEKLMRNESTYYEIYDNHFVYLNDNEYSIYMQKNNKND